MKKKIYLLSIIASVFFTSCDYLKEFDGLDDLVESKETTTYQYTITDADITTMVSALKANKTSADTLLANALSSNKVFSSDVSAAKAIPYLLKTKYAGANKGSAAKITYNYKTGTTGYYKLTAADYLALWGVSTVNALAPSKPAATVIPALLATKYPSAKEGDIKVVEYDYSDTNPASNSVEISSFSDTFEDYTAGSGVAVPTTSYMVNKDVKGAVVWQCRTFNSNKYAQVTSNGSGAENEVWLVTKQLDLTAANTSTKFSFDVCVGYYNATCLSVLVSQNFNGTESGIGTATWTDVTSSFTLPVAPASGYGTLATAGSMDFSAYAGKKVYVAFKYSGSAVSTPAKTTTYQIDNVKVGYTTVSTSISTKSTKYAYYKYEGGSWNAITKAFYELTADDYTSMGLTTLPVASAPNYLPALLKIKFPYAQEGDIKVCIHKTSATANTASEYIYSKGVWSALSLIEARTDQFVFSGWDQSGWVFDPTIRVTMKKGINPTDDYMLVAYYVKEKYGTTTPSLLYYYGTVFEGEYYYGFIGYYGNISWRESDRLKDPTFAALTTQEQKDEYFASRTKEGLAVYLSLKYPDTPLQVSGIDIYCYVTVPIYDGVTTANYVYKMKRVDTDLKWEFVSREKL